MDMNQNLLANAIGAIQANFKVDTTEFRGEKTLRIAPDEVVPAARMLRDEYAFDMLLDITAVDYWPENTPRFYLYYQLCATSLNQHLRLRVPVNGDTPQVPTMETVYPSANWYEREVWDLFGVRFEGHSDLRRIMMPEDWVGHPLRKDYPDGYEEVQFTFNVHEIQVRKLNPKD